MTDFLLPQQLYMMIKKLPGVRITDRKGIAAKGYFRPYMSLDEYTEAKLFTDSDREFPVIARFSAMIGDRGIADTVRNIKDFSVRFHTSDGDFDLISRSLPVFFTDEADNLPDVFRMFTGRICFDGTVNSKLWEFATLHPDSINCIIRFFSHMGLMASYTDIEWYPAFTYRWVNKEGKRFYVRMMWSPLKKATRKYSPSKVSMNRISAEFMAGFDPDAAAEELEARIRDGDFPCFELTAAVIPEEAADKNVTKQTLLWDEFIKVSVGEMMLTEIVSCESEITVPTFYPGNTVKGIEMSEDSLAKAFDMLYRIENAERRGGFEGI